MLTHTNGTSHINECQIPLRSRCNVLMLETITRLRLVHQIEQRCTPLQNDQANGWRSLFQLVRLRFYVGLPAILRAEIRRILYLVYGSLVSSLNSRYVTMSSSPTTKVQIFGSFFNRSKLCMCVCVCAINNSKRSGFFFFVSLSPRAYGNLTTAMMSRTVKKKFCSFASFPDWVSSGVSVVTVYVYINHFGDYCNLNKLLADRIFGFPYMQA